MNAPLTLTEDSFRALAASSPWRWRTLHFTRDDWGVEAWVRRPGEMVVRAHGELSDESEELGVNVSVGWIGAPPEKAPQIVHRYIGDTHPEFRTDGLVSGRGRRWPEVVGGDDGVIVHQDDPMFHNYTWVAMLDPVELEQGTVIRNLADADRDGRRTWFGTVSAAAGYQPRCGCCPLISCEAVARDEYGDDYVAPRDGFPEGFRIGLDVQTGVVVSSEPIGATSDSRVALTIHEVDGPVEVIDQVRVRPAVGQPSHTSAPHHGSAGGWAPYPTP